MPPYNLSVNTYFVPYSDDFFDGDFMCCLILFFSVYNICPNFPSLFSKSLPLGIKPLISNNIPLPFHELYTITSIFDCLFNQFVRTSTYTYLDALTRRLMIYTSYCKYTVNRLCFVRIARARKGLRIKH